MDREPGRGPRSVEGPAFYASLPCPMADAQSARLIVSRPAGGRHGFGRTLVEKLGNHGMDVALVGVSQCHIERWQEFAFFHCNVV